MLNTESIDAAMSVDGMTIRPALCLLAAFGEFAQSVNGEGSGLIEFGTYKGRVSALLGKIKRPKDSLHLVDVADYLDHQRLAQLGVQYHFYQSSSEKWVPVSANVDKFWFSHHDASHYFSNVSHELNMMRDWTSPQGVVVLDDFTDPYSQVRAAYYHQRYACDSPFELLLQGWGKAVLVRTSAFRFYEKFVLDGLQKSLEQLGCATTLYRTDAVPEARAFSIGLKKNPADPDKYGLQMWGDRFFRSTSP